jgi:hypothetical protein
MTEEALKQLEKAEQEAREAKDWQKVIDIMITQAQQGSRNIKKRGWVVLRKGWLTSSIHYRMTMEERFVFSMLIVLADEKGPVPGLISDNDCRAMPEDHLAHLCFAPLEVVQSTLQKGIEDESIFTNGHGVFLTHFKDYQFTEYDRQKKYREQWRDRGKQDPGAYAQSKLKGV